jgi:hypothetical protein
MGRTSEQVFEPSLSAVPGLKLMTSVITHLLQRASGGRAAGLHILRSSGQQDADENYARRQLWGVVCGLLRRQRISARLGYSFSVLFLFTGFLKFE